MNTNDKTLADVQPGGRVRLGDQAELGRHEFQAWTRELLPCPFCGNVAEFVPYKDNGLTLKCKSMGCIQRNQRTLRYGIDWLRTSMAEHWNTRALSAQPSPGGQGDQRSDLVPGIVRCAKCQFQLVRSNLNMYDGTVTAGDSKTEPCPNGCGPLWPLTWETWAREGWAEAERLHLENAALSAQPSPGGQGDQRSDLVPGIVRCAKCQFQLVRSNLNMYDGTVTAGDSKTEPCPNGCGPLWPLTWETWAREGWAEAERLHLENAALSAQPSPGGQGDARRQWLEIRGLAAAIVKNLQAFADSPHKAAWCGALDDSLLFADQIEKAAAAAYEADLERRRMA